METATAALSWESLPLAPTRRGLRILPLLFVSGEEDPVGGYAADVKAVAGKYREAGLKDLKEIYYPGSRHEILNEDIYPKVYADILNFMESHLSD